MRIIGPRPVERNGLRGFETTFHFGNTHSQPTKGESDAKSAHDDSVYEKHLIVGAGQSATREECQPLRKHQNAPAESVTDKISVTNTHSPDTPLSQVNSPASSSSPEPGSISLAEQREVGSPRFESVHGPREGHRPATYGKLVTAGETAPHSHASRNGEG